MKDAAIKKMLGLSQEEISMLLGVTRSQWSMYEIGQRDLPLEAAKQLAEILLHLQKAKGSPEEEEQFSAMEQRKKQVWLEQEYRDVAYKKQLVTRKRFTIENKRAACFAALETVRFFESQASDRHESLLQGIKGRVFNTLNKYPLHELEKIQMQEEHLEILKNRLEKKMKENVKEL